MKCIINKLKFKIISIKKLKLMRKKYNEALWWEKFYKIQISKDTEIIRELNDKIYRLEKKYFDG